MTARLVKILGVLLMLSAAALALSRAPDRPVQTLVARWAPPPSDFVDVKGQVTHVRDEGPRDDPLPVVLIHGTSASLHTWEGWVQALKPRRRVVTMDLPAFGLTGPSAAGDYRGDAYARFVLDLLDTLKIGRFVVGGNSLGGDVAWRVAVLAPERVDRLVLVDAAGPPFEPGSVPLGWRLAMVPGLSWLIEETLPRALVAQGIATAYADPKRITPELVDRYFELTLREGNRRALVQRLRQWKRGEGSERIDGIRAPTLVLWGARDGIIPLAIGREFERRIPGAKLVVFDDLGHVPHEEDPARTVRPVIEFLNPR
jgi:pimeloyl-ACP methyl ester carboxylesterase